MLSKIIKNLKLIHHYQNKYKTSIKLIPFLHCGRSRMVYNKTTDQVIAKAVHLPLGSLLNDSCTTRAVILHELGHLSCKDGWDHPDQLKQEYVAWEWAAAKLVEEGTLTPISVSLMYESYSSYVAYAGGLMIKQRMSDFGELVDKTVRAHIAKTK